MRQKASVLRNKKAKRLLLEQGLSVLETAAKLKVTPSTIRRYQKSWVMQAESEKQAKDCLQAETLPQGVEMAKAMMDLTEAVRQSLLEIQGEMDHPPVVKVKLIASLAHSLAKAVGAARRFAPELSIEVVVSEVLEITAQALTKKSPAAAQSLVECLEEIQTEVIKRKKAWQN